MARPRKELANVPLTPAMVNWAEALGDAIGRGMLRALNTGLPSLGSNGSGGGMGSSGMAASRRRGRPPKMLAGNGLVSSDRRCTVDGCGREQRSKGLCSAHYQAERRRLLAGGKPA